METVDHTQETSRPRWYWNVPIFVLIGILVPLGVRGLVTDDARYSWGTFCKQATYEIEYRWEMRDPDGSIVISKHWHDDELRGEAKKHLAGSKRLNTRYSVGAVKSWTTAYTKYMYEHRDQLMTPAEGGNERQSEVVRFTAEVFYRVNVSRKLHQRRYTSIDEERAAMPPKKRLFFAYPLRTPDEASSIPTAVKEDDA
jgi:hypothetical protein